MQYLSRPESMTPKGDTSGTTGQHTVTFSKLPSGIGPTLSESQGDFAQRWDGRPVGVSSGERSVIGAHHASSLALARDNTLSEDCSPLSCVFFHSVGPRVHTVQVTTRNAVILFKTQPQLNPKHSSAVVSVQLINLCINK